MAKKKMPVNVLEESAAGGAGEPVLDDLVERTVAVERTLH